MLCWAFPCAHGPLCRPPGSVVLIHSRHTQCHHSFLKSASQGAQANIHCIKNCAAPSFFVLHQWGYPRCTTRCCTELRTTLAILPERAEKHLLLPGLLPSCQTHLTIYKFTPTIAARCSTFLARCTAPAWVSSSWDRNPHSTPQLSIPALQAVYISTSLSPTNSVVEGSALI